MTVAKNHTHFKELEKINTPILAFMSSNDDITIRNIEKNLELIKVKVYLVIILKQKYLKTQITHMKIIKKIGLYIAN